MTQTNHTQGAPSEVAQAASIEKTIMMSAWRYFDRGEPEAAAHSLRLALGLQHESASASTPDAGPATEQGTWFIRSRAPSGDWQTWSEVSDASIVNELRKISAEYPDRHEVRQFFTSAAFVEPGGPEAARAVWAQAETRIGKLRATLNAIRQRYDDGELRERAADALREDDDDAATTGVEAQAKTHGEVERILFEATLGTNRVLLRASDGSYVSTYVQNDWEFWQARAALSANGTKAATSERLFANRVPEAAARQCACVLAWLTECTLAALEDMKALKSTSVSRLQRQQAICDKAVAQCVDLGVEPVGLRGHFCNRLRDAIEATGARNG